jgi:hypothetical protein
MLISRRLLDVAHRLDGLRTAAEPATEPVPIESLVYQPEPDVVPVESLAPDAPSAAQPPPASSPGGLEASFRTLARLAKQNAPTTASLDILLGPADKAPAASSTEPPAVSIDSLCYRGQAALERANVVRHQIAAGLTGDASLESLQPLLQELLDLVPLALDEAR